MAISSNTTVNDSDARSTGNYENIVRSVAGLISKAQGDAYRTLGLSAVPIEGSRNYENLRLEVMHNCVRETRNLPIEYFTDGTLRDAIEYANEHYNAHFAAIQMALLVDYVNGI